MVKVRYWWKSTSDENLIVINVREVKVVKEVERSDSLWRFACSDVYFLQKISLPIHPRTQKFRAALGCLIVVRKNSQRSQFHICLKMGVGGLGGTENKSKLEERGLSGEGTWFDLGLVDQRLHSRPLLLLQLQCILVHTAPTRVHRGTHSSAHLLHIVTTFTYVGVYHIPRRSCWFSYRSLL